MSDVKKTPCIAYCGVTPLILLLLQIMSVPAISQAVGSSKEAQRTETLPLYLHDAGIRLGLYFTIESDLVNNRPDSFIMCRNVTANQVTTPQDLVTQLQEELTGVNVFRDEKNPNIIHLVDNELYQEAFYPLNKKVSVDFSGPLGNLADVIALRNQLKLGSSLIVLDNEPGTDIATKITVHTYDLSVRSTLSNAVPLANYDPILWTSYVYASEPQGRVSITYTGPLSKQRDTLYYK